MEQSHHDVGAMIQLSAEQCRSAALAVCGAARDQADAELLLDEIAVEEIGDTA